MLGSGIVAAVFVGLFVVTAFVTGWRVSLAAWGFSVALTAALVVGLGLATGDLP